MDDKVIAKLRKLMVMALAGNDGESENALAAVKRWMKRNKKDAYWVLTNVGEDRPAPPPSQSYAEPSVSWFEQLHFLLHTPGFVSPREADFIGSLVYQMGRGYRDWQPTAKQSKWLGSIYTRVRLARGAYQQ